MKRLFVLTIKYIPIIQLIGMLINNSLYTYDINIEFDYIGDFLLGNSIVNISMLYVCSFTFGFCNWHRHIITANLINIIIATIDKVFHIPVTDIELLMLQLEYLYYLLLEVMLKKLREMMNVKIRLLRGLLEEAIKNIDAGNSNHTEEELNAIIDDLTKLNRGIKRISKTYACEKILHCSPSTFDTYVKLGIIPPGHKEVGFKELSWSPKDFDEATMNKVRKYSSRKGL